MPSPRVTSPRSSRPIPPSRGRHREGSLRRVCGLLAAVLLGCTTCTESVQAASVTSTGIFTFGTSGNVSSFTYNGTPIANLTVGSLLKVGGTSSTSSGNFRASGWPLDASGTGALLTGAPDLGDYFSFTMNAASGYTFDIDDVTFGFGRSSTGPRSSQWRSNVDNYAAAIGSYSSLGGSGLFAVSGNALHFSTDSAATTGTNVVLTMSGSSAAYQGLSSIDLRWYAYNAESSAGTGGFQGPLSFTVTVNSSNPSTPIGSYDPPAGYYGTATGTGSVLKNQLNAIIDDHVVFTYEQARSALQVTDADPASPGRLLLVYDRVSLDVSSLSPGGPIPGWDNGLSWNREHTWADSRGLGGTGPDYSDLHHLRAATPSVNSSRGNKNFGGAYGAQPYGAVTDGGAAVWYPGDADAGMVARHEFYMATRYDGVDASTADLELLPGDPSEAQGLGSLTRMVEWHFHAVPDDFELRRNQIIYADYQQNRNPYIDNPEYVWSVFVDQANDSQLFVGSAAAASGSSSLDVNLGRVIVNGTVPAAQSVALRRTGHDGTYYRVSASGSATSSVTGKFNAFPINTSGSDSTTLSVGLNTSTGEAGLKTGSVLIDNLDITTGGGAGRGANDANDQIAVSLSVLHPATASFLAGSGSSSLMLDFGTLTQGAAAGILTFDIFNVAGALGTEWTAALDLDGIAETDPGGVFTTSLLPFLNLGAGASQSAIVSMSTSLLGSFTGSYLLSLSDEDLAGAGVKSMSISVAGTVIPIPEPWPLGIVGLWGGLAVVPRRRPVSAAGPGRSRGRSR